MHCKRGWRLLAKRDMKNHDLHMLAVEGHCERGKADRYSVRSHKTLALPCGGSLGCSLADRICPYRNGLLPQKWQ
jgi:hypothetical protein